jgi:hypothetical protein
MAQDSIAGELLDCVSAVITMRVAEFSADTGDDRLSLSVSTTNGAISYPRANNQNTGLRNTEQ